MQLALEITLVLMAMLTTSSKNLRLSINLFIFDALKIS